MARTKQTSRKSTGGLAPRAAAAAERKKQLAAVGGSAASNKQIKRRGCAPPQPDEPEVKANAPELKKNTYCLSMTLYMGAAQNPISAKRHVDPNTTTLFEVLEDLKRLPPAANKVWESASFQSSERSRAEGCPFNVTLDPLYMFKFKTLASCGMDLKAGDHLFLYSTDYSSYAPTSPSYSPESPKPKPAQDQEQEEYDDDEYARWR
jgi:hypothetical protein